MYTGKFIWFFFRFKEKILPKFELEKELSELEKSLESLGYPSVFSHNDLLLKNIIYSKEESMYTVYMYILITAYCYVPITVISLSTVDFTEHDPMLQCFLNPITSL